MGEVFAGRQLGRRAMLWGALAQSIPDIDFLAALWLEPSANLLAHRGFSHSLLFCALVTLLLAWIAERWHRPHNISRVRWMLFFGGAVFIHIFIDAFNNYGVGWFEPLSHLRISFNAIYVADPFFSVWPGLACLVLVLARKKDRLRRVYAQAGLGASALYLCYCLGNKSSVDAEVRQLLHRQQIVYTRYLTTPAPMQSWLWYVVAGTDSGYYTGYRSLFDRSDTLALQYFPRREALLGPLQHRDDVKRLIRFSRQFYTIEQWHDTLVFNDLRFGQVVGWAHPRGKFAFYYYLYPQADNTLAVQRGRFEGWNRHTLEALWKRIKGQ